MFMDFKYERRTFYVIGKEDEGKTFHKWHILLMNNKLCDRGRELGREIWK